MKHACDMIRSAKLVQDEAHVIDCYVDDDGDLGLTQKNGTDRLDYVLLGRGQMAQLHLLLGQLLKVPTQK